ATDVPLTIDWEGWRLGPMDTPRVLDLCRELGFRSLAAQVQEAAPPQSDGEPEQGELFPFGANTDVPSTQDSGFRPPRASTWKATYNLIDTPAKFQSFLKQLNKQPRFAVDLETTSLSPLESEIVGFAFSWKEGEAHYLALRGPEGSALLDPAKT